MADITPVSCTRKRSMSSSIQKPNWNRCLRHVKENFQGQLTSFTGKSWEKFQSCSTRRRDAIWLIMEDYWNEGPKGGYHWQCYQEYTDINNVSKSLQYQTGSRWRGLLGSPVALSLRLRGSGLKHLTLINVKFVRRTKSRKATAKEQEQENHLH